MHGNFLEKLLRISLLLSMIFYLLKSLKLSRPFPFAVNCLSTLDLAFVETLKLSSFPFNCKWGTDFCSQSQRKKKQDSKAQLKN